MGKDIRRQEVGTAQLLVEGGGHAEVVVGSDSIELGFLVFDFMLRHNLSLARIAVTALKPSAMELMG